MIHSASSHAKPPIWRAPAFVLPLLLLGACGGGSDTPETEAAGDDVMLGAGPAAEVSAGPAPASGAGAGTESSAAPGTTSPTAAAPAPAVSDAHCGLPGFQADLLSRINAARASARSCGATSYSAVSPLNWNGALFAAAENHSREMAVNNYFSHTGLDGRSVAQRVTAAGYAWRAVGENIAAGQSSPNAVMSGWLSSSGHCSNIMSAQYQDVAVACVERSGSTYGHYWTMVLARPS